VIQLPETPFGYLLVQCADEQRSERLNIGVLAFDPAASRVEVRMVDSFERVTRALPSVSVSHIRGVLEAAQEHAEAELVGRGVEALLAACERATGAIRFSPPRSVMARRLSETADALLQRYVEVANLPALAVHAERVPASTRRSSVVGGEYTSRRVVRSIRSRLRRRLTEDAYTADVVLHGTIRNVRVPIYYPLRVGRHLYLDALDVSTEHHSALDSSRAIAQKITETKPADENAEVGVVIRDPQMGEEGEIAEAVIRQAATESGFDRNRLTIGRYAEPGALDEWVNQAVQPYLAGF
jgi:hypothetical protein